MIIRYFTSPDLSDILQIWNRNCQYDILTIDVLKEKTIEDIDFDPNTFLVAEKNNSIAAFMMGVIRPSDSQKRGWIKLFAVDKANRRQGIGTRLLKDLESSLIKKGIQKIQIMDVPGNHLLPGVDPRYTEAAVFLERKGYQVFDHTSNLKVDLVHQSFSTLNDDDELKKKNIFLRRAEGSDESAIVNLCVENSKNHWITLVKKCFQNLPISTHVALINNQIKAFSSYDCNNIGMGWIGPILTDSSLRGKGIGGILLKRSLYDIQQQGHRTGIIPWVGPIPFYMKYANAHVYRVFWRYTKDVTSSISMTK